MRRRDWSQLIPGAQFTTMGSLAYKLALVAAGRFDGLVSLRASYDWDSSRRRPADRRGGRSDQRRRRCAADPQSADATPAASPPQVPLPSTARWSTACARSRVADARGRPKVDAGLHQVAGGSQALAGRVGIQLRWGSRCGADATARNEVATEGSTTGASRNIGSGSLLACVKQRCGTSTRSVVTEALSGGHG